MAERVLDLASIAQLQDAGKRIARPAAWAAVGFFFIGVVVTALNAVRNGLGWVAGFLWLLLATLVMAVFFVTSLNNALFTLGPSPVRLEVLESRLRFVRHGGKVRDLRWIDPRFRIDIHDLRARPELRPRAPITGDIRWLERFALRSEGLDALLTSARAHNLEVREDQYNDWLGIGAEHRLVILPRRGAPHGMPVG